MTPTARTLNLLRAEGWTCQTVESWIPRLNIRRDLWGIGDVLAMKPGEPLLLPDDLAGVTAILPPLRKRKKAEPSLFG